MPMASNVFVARLQAISLMAHQIGLRMVLINTFPSLNFFVLL